MGSVTLQSNSQKLEFVYDYTPFGSRASTEILKIISNTCTGNPPWLPSNPFRFSNEYHDTQTNLIYYNYRYYNPQTGRWTKKDDIEERAGINLYAMVNNDVVNDWDYLGEFSIWKYLFREGLHEIDITTGWFDIVATLKVDKPDKNCCTKISFSGGVSKNIFPKKIINTILGVLKRSSIGRKAAKFLEKRIPNFSVQMYFTGSGTMGKSFACKGFCELAVTFSITAGNGAHGGEHTRFFDFGVWGYGTGKWNFCKGTLTVYGGIQASANLNVGFYAYNKIFDIIGPDAILIGPKGSNSLLPWGGLYKSLKWR